MISIAATTAPVGLSSYSREGTVLQAGACEANPSRGCSGFRHRFARLDRGADWRERQEVEEGGDRRAIIELAPIKQVADRAEGHPRHPGCLGGVGRWSLHGRPVGLVAVEAGIADPDVGAVGAQQRERTRFPAGLLQNLAAGGLGRFFTRVDPAAVQQPLA